MGVVSKILAIYKEKGLFEVIARGLKKIIRPFFDTNSAFWFECELSSELPPVISALPVEINLFSADETIDWIKKEGKDWMYNPRELEVGLKEQHYFPNVKYQNKIIGYAKVGLNKVYIQDFKKILNLAKDLAFIYDTYVEPRYRGLNVAPSLIWEVIESLKNMRIKKVGCHIPVWNTASLSSYAKLGFRKINYIRYLNVLGFKIFTTNPEVIYDSSGNLTSSNVSLK